MQATGNQQTVDGSRQPIDADGGERTIGDWSTAAEDCDVPLIVGDNRPPADWGEASGPAAILDVLRRHHRDYDQWLALCRCRVWKCKNKNCGKQFSIRVGTVMEDSPLGLDKWLVAIWTLANAKNGISSWEVHRALGITQKSAWFLLHRIRLAMQTGTFCKLSGECEVDERFIGGKARNMHADKREEKIHGRGSVGKAIVIGLLERGGKVKTKVIPNTQKGTVQPLVHEHVDEGSLVCTDALRSYEGLDAAFIREVVDHAVEYVRGNVHTNGLENFWSLLKRTIRGSYVSVEPFHLSRYLDEQTHRFNERKRADDTVKTDGERFVEVARMIAGKRLTYAKLIGKEQESPPAQPAP
jgi:transposase-like protein